MKNRILLFLILTASFNITKAQTTVPALITSSQVWDLSGSPYLITQNTYVDTGVSILVKPGVEVKATGIYNININGEFQAIGKWDSIIKFTKVELSFSSNSKDYNSSTGRGAYFKYCNLEGQGSGYTTIRTNTTALRVDYCNFTNTYYAINITGSSYKDSLITEITNSKFSGDMYGYGTAIYGNNMTSKLILTNCYISSVDQISVYGNITAKNNTFTKMRKVYFGYLFGTNDISCNKFRLIGDGVSVDLGYQGNNKGKLSFKDNTFDSVGKTITGPAIHMFTLNKPPSNSTAWGKIEINDNNFLTYLGKGAKAAITSTNYTPTKTDSVDFTGNHWGTNDSTTITTYISDYNDNINVYGRAIFKNYEANPIVGCSYNINCAIANFSYTQQDSVVTFTDQSYSTKSYKVKWKFGDGNKNDSNKTVVVHHYGSAGNYLACLYVYDTAENLCDSMCQVIVVKSKSSCNASYYVAVDTSNTNNIYIVNTSSGTNAKTKYYWTFGDGTGSGAKNPTHTYASAGRYQLCLTLFDSLAPCFSTFCDSVEITSSNMILLVLDEDDLAVKSPAGIIRSVSLYPNPTKDFVKVSLFTNTNEAVQMDVLNSEGKLVKSETFTPEIGSNEMMIDLSEFENGLYCVNLRSENYSKTIKVILNK